MLHIGAVWLAEIGEFVLIRLRRVWRLLNRRIDIGKKTRENEEEGRCYIPVNP
jgi:hypothetical protein